MSAAPLEDKAAVAALARDVSALLRDMERRDPALVTRAVELARRAFAIVAERRRRRAAAAGKP